tara:strand:+ start:844 stop:1638 length:795 start_codon:yes stop_codon:yes gene_type:complete
MVKLSKAHVSLDENGRLDPSPNLNGDAHAVSRNYFQFPNDSVGLSESYKLLRNAFENIVSETIFKEKQEALYTKARKLLGLGSSGTPLVYSPFFLPKMRHDDIGLEIENVYFPAIQNSYKAECPDNDFTVEFKDSLEGKIKSIPGLGHDRLEAAVRESDILGLSLFILREYSVQAAREQITVMPTDFSLTGMLDLSGSLVARPKLMFNTEQYAPMVWTPSCETPWEHANFHYEAYGYNLMFNRRVHHDLVAEYWSHGVSIFESV